MRLASHAKVRAVDVDRFTELLAAFVRAWRSVRFDDGIYVGSDGRHHPGFRVEDGVHPAPGSRYRLVLTTEHPPEPTATTTYRLRVETDDPAALRLRVEADTPDDLNMTVLVEEPARPRHVRAEGSLSVRGGWLVRGRADGDLDVDLGAIPGRQSDRQAQGRVSHRLAAGTAIVGIRELGRGDWEVEVTISVEGRGCMWPLGVVAGLVWKHAARKELDTFMAHLPEMVDELRQVLTTEPDLDAAARRMLAELLAEAAG